MLSATSKQKMLYSALNLISWYACVSLANTSLEPFVVTVIIFNYWSFRRLFPTYTWRNLWKIVFAGFVFDQLMILLDIIRIPALPVMPLWLVALWCLFSMSMPVYLSLKVFEKRNAAFMIGAVGGLTSYMAGEKFGVLYLPHWYSFVIYGITWGTIFYHMPLIGKAFHGEDKAKT